MPATPQLITVDPAGQTVAVVIADVYGAPVTTYATAGGSAHVLPKIISAPTNFFIEKRDTYRVKAYFGGVDVGGLVALGTDAQIEYRVSYPATQFPAAGGIGSRSLGSPAVGATTAVHAAVTDTAVPVTVTTDITNPDVARNITATAGGTAEDVKAVAVVVTGTNIMGATIIETLPAFTVNTTGTVIGNKAFATVTSVTIPAHDGTGATTAIGTGAKLGLPVMLTRNTVMASYLANVLEGTPATVTTDADEVEKNTVSLSSTLNDSEVVVALLP